MSSSISGVTADPPDRELAIGLAVLVLVRERLIAPGEFAVACPIGIFGESVSGKGIEPNRRVFSLLTPISDIGGAAEGRIELGGRGERGSTAVRALRCAP
jgi:hypothetical protein